MLFMVIVLTPFYIIYFILSSSHLVSVGMRKPLTLITWCAYFYIFWKLGDPFPILSPKHGILSIGISAKYIFVPLNYFVPSRAGHQSGGGDRGYDHGAALGVRRRELSLHQYEHVHEVELEMNLCEDCSFTIPFCFYVRSLSIGSS